jgi:hypothetical protein
MKYVLLLITLAGIIAIQGCDNKATKEKDTDAASTEPQVTVSDSSGAIETVEQSITTLPVQDSSSIPVSTDMNIVAQPASGPGLNPAHGEPGHRCDIAVGAPLNSPAGNKPVSPTIVNETPVTPDITMPAITPQVNPTPATDAAQTPTAPGMNPPHGQPGHDCAIAVGAPLKK